MIFFFFCETEMSVTLRKTFIRAACYSLSSQNVCTIINGKYGLFKYLILKLLQQLTIRDPDFFKQVLFTLLEFIVPCICIHRCQGRIIILFHRGVIILTARCLEEQMKCLYVFSSAVLIQAQILKFTDIYEFLRSGLKSQNSVCKKTHDEHISRFFFFAL